MYSCKYREGYMKDKIKYFINKFIYFVGLTCIVFAIGYAIFYASNSFIAGFKDGYNASAGMID